MEFQALISPAIGPHKKNTVHKHKYTCCMFRLCKISELIFLADYHFLSLISFPVHGLDIHTFSLLCLAMKSIAQDTTFLTEKRKYFSYTNIRSGKEIL